MFETAAPYMLALLVVVGLAFGDRVAEVVATMDRDDSLTDWE